MVIYSFTPSHVLNLLPTTTMPHPDNPPALDVQNDDESIRVDIAVRALGDMRSRASVSSPEG